MRKHNWPPKGATPKPERTASWGALPGKTQPRDRSAGKPRCPVYPKSKGL